MLSDIRQGFKWAGLFMGVAFAFLLVGGIVLAVVVLQASTSSAGRTNQMLGVAEGEHNPPSFLYVDELRGALDCLSDAQCAQSEQGTYATDVVTKMTGSTITVNGTSVPVSGIAESAMMTRIPWSEMSSPDAVMTMDGTYPQELIDQTAVEYSTSDYTATFHVTKVPGGRNLEYITVESEIPLPSGTSLHGTDHINLPGQESTR